MIYKKIAFKAPLSRVYKRIVNKDKTNSADAHNGVVECSSHSEPTTV